MLLGRVAWLQSRVENLKKGFEASREKVRETHRSELALKDDAIRELQEKIGKINKKLRHLDRRNRSLKADLESVSTRGEQ